jgi:hypothetical protein
MGSRAGLSAILAGSNKLLTPAVVMLLVALISVGGRLLFAADGDPTVFIQAGRVFVDPAGTPSPIKVYPHTGYDGQFAYRAAIDPLDVRTSANGVRYDNPLRLQRLTYPALAWLLSLGRGNWVPYSLIAVNVIGLFALGWLGGMLALHFGRHALFGLLPAGYWGFAQSLGRDLTEITTCVFLLAGIIMFLKKRYLFAGGSFAVAALSRETSVVIIAAVVLVAAAERFWKGKIHLRGTLELAATAVPAVVAFSAWQLYCWTQIGQFPVVAGTAANLGFPLTDLIPAAFGWFRDLGGGHKQRAALVLLQFVALACLAFFTARAIFQSRAPLPLKVSWVLIALTVASLTHSVWIGPADFRTAAEMYLLGAVVLLGSRRLERVPVGIAFVTGAATFGIRLFYL